MCGDVAGTRGPVREIVTGPEYLDVSLPAGRSFTRTVKPGYNVFAYVVNGEGYFDPERNPWRVFGIGLASLVMLLAMLFAVVLALPEGFLPADDV